MARPLRIEYPGALYHVTARGNARQDIFHDDHDRREMLDLLKEIITDLNWICHAYCLMTNHYHLLVETSEGNLSRGMRHLNGIYTQRFNRRHSLTGHVFQGRYKAIVVEKDTYLLALCRYIVRNPSKAGLVHTPAEWPWSSYRDTAGIVKGEGIVHADWILSQFSDSPPAARRAYHLFVLSEKEQPNPWESLQGGIYLGKGSLMEKMKVLTRGKERFKEIPRKQRYATRPPLSEIIGKVSAASEDPDKIYSAYKDYGYTLKQIGDHVGLHYSTISRHIKRQKEVGKSGKKTVCK